MKVSIVADSISPRGKRITTFSLEYWRAFHSELMTHRLLSRSSSSSRAIPVKKMIDRVLNDTAMPMHWGKNQKGMQADQELSPEEIEKAKLIWVDAAQAAVHRAEKLMDMGIHKQVANRLLEPFSYINTVVTATELGNFYNLRYHKKALPDFAALAQGMWEAQQASTPTPLWYGEWHLPYIDATDRFHGIENLKKMSAARCARVSYLNHEGKKPTFEEDMRLFAQLMEETPKHAGPTEHQARPSSAKTTPADAGELADAQADAQMEGNFRGWVQFRKTIPGECMPIFEGPEL